jgi:hypothetical protein
MIRRKPGELNLRVLDVRRASPSPFAHIEVSLGPERREIRWGIDEFTYSRLRRAFDSRPMGAMPGMKFEHKLMHAYHPLDPDGKGTCILECTDGRMKESFKFECSHYFSQNLVWICSNMKTLDELEHVDWSEHKDDA